MLVTGVVAGSHVIGVTAKNAVGTSPEASISFSNVRAPGVPRNVRTDGDHQLVTITWSSPSDSGGEITGYDVQFGDQMVSLGDVTTAEFSGVAPGDYLVGVRTKNNVGVSSWSVGTTVEIRTEPGRPRNIELDVDAQRVTITWIGPENDGGRPVTAYRVRFAGTDQIVTGTSLVLDDIDSGNWAAEVAAINDIGTGEFGTTSSVGVERIFEPFGDVNEFLSQQYADFLGRSPDAGGLQY